MANSIAVSSIVSRGNAPGGMTKAGHAHGMPGPELTGED
jgi:hypothetical protein